MEMIISVWKRYDMNGAFTHDIELKIGRQIPDKNSMWRLDSYLKVNESNVEDPDAEKNLKKDALDATRSRFTNLIDGKVLPRATVTEIIMYYQQLVDKIKPSVVYRPGNIEENFIEDEIKDMMPDEDEL